MVSWKEDDFLTFVSALKTFEGHEKCGDYIANQRRVGLPGSKKHFCVFGAVACAWRRKVNTEIQSSWSCELEGSAITLG